MAKQILRVEPIHSSQDFAVKWKHNMRIGNVPNADKSLYYQNEHLIKLPPGETYMSYFEKRLAKLPYYDTHKLRKGGVIGFELLLSFGTKNFPPDFSMEQWKEQNKQFLYDTFGRENVVSAILHLDEGTPHIHVIIFPIENGRLRARAFLPDRQSMRDLHVKYHEYTKECGLEPENQYTHMDHIKIGMFYHNINLALKKELPEPEETESLKDYVTRVNEFYKTQVLRSFSKEIQFQQLQKENDALTKANRTIEERTKKKYERALNEIMKEIGSVRNAKHAIQYRDSLQKAILYTQQINPELAESVTTIIINMQQNYERLMAEREQESPAPDDY